VIAEMPPLLKAYMRLGAKICGEPCWDEDFQVADVFILLKRDELCPRYARHFKAACDAPVARVRAHRAVLLVVALGLSMASVFGVFERMGVANSMVRRQRWSRFFMARLSNALPFG
jgi:hypothetical protein